jgi:hypothetical protein
MKNRQPLYITFDTNAYSGIAQPNVTRLLEKLWPITKDRYRSKLQRLCWWYLNICIQKRRIIAAISEASLKAEALRNCDRTELLISIGTTKASSRPAIPQARQKVIRAALKLGFRILHSHRIGYSAVYSVDPTDWASDVHHSSQQRQHRESMLNSDLGDTGYRRLCDFGEQLAVTHNLHKRPQNAYKAYFAQLHGITLARFLWRDGLAAESAAPRLYKTIDEFEKQLRNYMAEWADLDVVTSHYGYAYDILCTEDQGKLPGTVFSTATRQSLETTFALRFMTVRQLSFHCLVRFAIPIISWPQIN